MRRSLSVRTPSSPFKSVEDRDINIKKLSDIKKQHASAALELANTALVAMQKLKALEETMSAASVLRRYWSLRQRSTTKHLMVSWRMASSALK